ncbi:hypothetical protein OIU84_017238, partial [Salix udensis]
MIPCPN